jgi:hypothetical protein
MHWEFAHCFGLVNFKIALNEIKRSQYLQALSLSP